MTIIPLILSLLASAWLGYSFNNIVRKWSEKSPKQHF